MHSIDREAPFDGVLARSLDGGESWSLEEPEDFPEGFTFGGGRTAGREAGRTPEVPIDFTETDLAIRCRNDLFLVSRDRGHSWEGPYSFPDFGFAEQ